VLCEHRRDDTTVGWVERSEPHQHLSRLLVGLAALGPPCYGWTSQGLILDFVGRYIGLRPREEEKSWAGWMATVDQPDIRGLVTDMT